MRKLVQHLRIVLTTQICWGPVACLRTFNAHSDILCVVLSLCGTLDVTAHVNSGA